MKDSIISSIYKFISIQVLDYIKTLELEITIKFSTVVTLVFLTLEETICYKNVT